MRGVWRNSLEVMAERAERREARKWRKALGQDNRSRKVTPMVARKIRAMRASGEKRVYVAHLFGISDDTVSRVTSGKLCPERGA